MNQHSFAQHLFKGRKFYKLQALGNSYIVLDSQDWPESDLDGSASHIWISQLCSKEWGVGSDGVLWGPDQSNNSQARLRIFNTDASEAEKSGNGIRIFSRYLRDQRSFPAKFDLHTKGGQVQVEDLGEGGIRVQMGAGKLIGAAHESFLEELSFAGHTFKAVRVSVGNPHCVVFEGFDHHNEETIKKWGPLIENDSLFPQRTNVQFAKILDSQTLSLQIWERGSGYTLASGSSSCAAAFAAFKMGYVQSRLKVIMPGGAIQIEIDSHDNIWMQGDVQWICDGCVR